MQIDNLALACLVKELNPVVSGSHVNKVSELADKSLKIKLHTKQGSKELIITGAALFLSSYSHPARQGKTPFAESLKKNLYNKRIVAIEQHGSDRIVIIKFIEHLLVLEFIGEGNKALLGKDGKIIACQKKEEWSDRKIAKGEIYKFPKQSGLDPARFSSDDLHKLLSGSGKDVIRGIISSVNVSPVAAEEVLHSLKIDKSKKASSVSAAEASLISEKIMSLYSLDAASISQCAYKDFSYPFRLTHLSEEPKKIPSLNSFFDESFAHSLGKEPIPEDGKKKPGRKGGLEFMKAQQAEAKKKFESQIAEARAKAELIYSNYPEIEALLKLASECAKAKMDEAEISLEIKKEAEKGNSVAKAFRRIDLKKKTIELEFS